REAMERAAREFVDSPYLQTPPMYSAKKVDGKRLYEIAREGAEVERKAVECRVLEFSLEKGAGAETTPANSESASIRVRVSSGTYVRTLAEDWAAKLGALA